MRLTCGIDFPILRPAVTPGYVMPTLLLQCCRRPQPYSGFTVERADSQTATDKPGNTGELQRRHEMRKAMESVYDQSSAAFEDCDIDEVLSLIEDSEPWEFTDPADEPE